MDGTLANKSNALYIRFFMREFSPRNSLRNIADIMARGMENSRQIATTKVVETNIEAMPPVRPAFSGLSVNQ
jgi:hypothetical protein